MPSLLRLAVTATAAALAVPAAAAAAPPPNDNYLASTTLVNSQGTTPGHFAETIDTTEATTQPDTFNPDKDGLPLGGGPPEPTTCGATSFGKTAWWDFQPPSKGAVEIKAAGGFDVVVAVYQWSATTSKITKLVKCQNADPGTETLDLFSLKKGQNYTVQVGGAGNTGGPLQFTFDYFRDRDGDGVFDSLDDCRTLPGTTKGGCPPTLQAAPRISYDKPGNGVIVRALTVDDMVKGAKAEVRCTRCSGGKVVRKARHGGSLSLNGFLGRFVRAGGSIEIRVSKAHKGKGKFRYGAIGKYFRYPVNNGGLGKRKLRCLKPGSRKPVKCS